MKKRIIAFALCAISLLLIACQKDTAEKNNEDYHLYTERIKCYEAAHPLTMKSTAFPLYLVTTELEPEVELIGVKGKNTDKCEVKYLGFDEEIDLGKQAYRGYYLRVLEIEVVTDEPDVSIDSMTMKINGKVEEYTYKHPIHIMHEDWSPEGPVDFDGFMMVMVMSDFKEGSHAWDFYAKEDVLIDSVEFNDLIKLKDIRVIIGDSIEQSLEEGSPVRVPAGCSFSLFFGAESAMGEEWKESDFMRMNIILRYTSVETGEQYELKGLNAFTIGGINEDDVHEIIDSVIEGQSQGK